MEDIKKTVWELFERTGQIGYYNLFKELTEQDS